MEVSFFFIYIFVCFFTLGTILTFLFFFFFRDGLPQRGLDLELQNGGKFFYFIFVFCYFYYFRNDTNVPLLSFFLRAGSSHSSQAIIGSSFLSQTHYPLPLFLANSFFVQ